MKQYQVAIVEDEDKAAELLQKYLEQYGERESLCFDITHYTDASAFLKDKHKGYDLIFMDIQMPGMNGMEAAHKMREMDLNTTLVFVTNMVQFAVKGYEVDAADFILKPVRYTSFSMKMRRILQIAESKRGKSVALSVGGETKVVPLREIYFIEVKNHDLTYHTMQGDVVMRGNMSSAQAKLPEDMFFRCSAAFLINLRYVTQIGSEEVEVQGNHIRISRGKKKELVQALTTFLGKGV